MKLRSGLCLVGGLAAVATSLLLTAAVVSAYAITLGIQLGGQPSQEQIESFAAQVSPIMGPMLLLMATVVAARRVARETNAPALHGTLVGVVAATTALLPARPIDLRDVAITIAVIGAGWLAGTLSKSK